MPRLSSAGFLVALALLSLATGWRASIATAQEVGLPAPRLLTLYPPGGEIGSSFGVEVSGQYIDDAKELLFSDPQIVAKAKLTAEGKPESGKFIVVISTDARPGIYEARLMTRLGISTSRAFSVGTLPEVTREKDQSITTPQTALRLEPDAIANGYTTPKAVDHYLVHGTKGQRLVADCAAAGIDSKLIAVLILADSAGHDLLVNRRGGILDFTFPADGDYLIKVQDLTYQGGINQFYRLAVRLPAAGAPIVRQPSTAAVSSSTWAGDDKSNLPETAEIEPNDKPAQAQQITLPVEIAGSFFPAADVDLFEFQAKKGETWWVEVASERLGLPTDPFVVVQQVTKNGDAEKLDDVAELPDITSPMKPASGRSNSYDGPPYDPGSGDVLGKVDIPADGAYRLSIRDLLGSTRSDPANRYKLSIRKAAPDFALIGWAWHTETRNADRVALPEPIALRGGTTMALEVVAIRREGFTGEIELAMDDLPEGVTATGLKIAANVGRGLLLITAAEDAPRGLSTTRIFGRAQIGGQTVTRPGALASMIWPVKDLMFEVPDSRLLADVQVSVGGAENAPLSIAPAENKVVEAKVGEKLSIPLALKWRGEATSPLKLRTFGDGFSAAPPVDIALNAATAEAVFDLAALKAKPGEYVVALYGSQTTKYRYNVPGIAKAEAALKKAETRVASQTALAKKLADEAQSAPADKKAQAEALAKAAAEGQKAAEAENAQAAARVKAATSDATPVLFSEVIVSEPIRIVVKPADGK